MDILYCGKAHETMDQLVLGVSLTSEEQKSLDSHLESCSSCMGRWSHSEKVSQSLGKSFQQLVSTFESPRVRVLLQLQREVVPKKEEPLWKRWGAFSWMVLFLTLMLVILAYLGLFLASRIWQNKLQKIWKDTKKTVQFMEEYKEKKGLYPHPSSLIPLRDPWGNPYQIRQTGNEILIYSFGVNGRDDGGKEDDLWSLWIVKDKIYIKKNSLFKEGVQNFND